MAGDELGMHVDRPRPVEPGAVHLLDAARHLDAGMVVQDVDAAVPLGDIRDQSRRPRSSSVTSRWMRFRLPARVDDVAQPSGARRRGRGR